MLRCRPTPAPRPRLRAPIRWPCWAWRGWPRPGWHRRALPDRPADGGGCCGPCCGSGRGRVAGKPCQHHSDRLGLLLRKEAASLTAQQLHLVVNRGGPGRGRRPRRRPWLAAAAAGLRAGGLGQGSGLGMYGSLLAVDGGWHRWPRSTAEFHGWGSVAPDPERVSITPIRASARSPGPTPTSVPSRRRSSAKAARRGGAERAAPRRPRQPQDGPRPGGMAGSGRPAQLGSACSPQPPGSHPGGGAAVRSPTDHRPFTRSAAR